MNYGFMTFSFPKATVSALLEAATQFGYTGIELRISANHGHGLEPGTPVDQLAEARKQAQGDRVSLYSIATSFKLALGALDEEEAKRTLALATGIGARVIRVFGGAYTDEGMGNEQARSQLVAGLRRFGELSHELTAGHAEQRGGAPDASVVIALESHDAWTDPAILAGVLEEVGRDNVGLNWDAYHIVRMHDVGVAEHFPTVKRWVKHVHVHDGTASKQSPVLKPIGTGVVNHQELMQCLAEIEFDGYLMGEWIHGMMDGNTDPMVYLPREIAKLTQLEAALG